MSTTSATTPVLGAAEVTRGLLRGARPRQWVKNLLVLAAPVASGRVLDVEVLVGALVAFGAFSLAASGVYFVNDVADREADRAHPRKRYRPVAAGTVSVRLAIIVAAVLLAAALGLAALAGAGLLLVLAVYMATSVGYSLALKHEPVIDIAVVASGFLLRAMAGGAAAGIALSQWFLLAAAFGSLFIAAGKRYAEAKAADTEPAKMRRALARYSDSYLRFVWGLSAAVLIMTYGLWAFDMRGTTGSVLPTVSMVPFVLAILRYAVDVDAGGAGDPEEIAFADHVLQVLGLVWLGLVAAAVYA